MTPLYQTPGASPTDGYAQMVFFYTNMTQNPQNWIGYCWRPGWDAEIISAGESLAYYHGIRDHCLNTWGDGSYITFQEFCNCTNVADATFIFLACFEGPLHPLQYDSRVTSANKAMEIISGDTPPDPPQPPVPGTGKKMPWIYYLKIF